MQLSKPGIVTKTGIILHYSKKNNEENGPGVQTSVDVSANNKCIKDGQMNHV